jgi:uncharacterized protein (DUF1015 family)
VAVVRPFRAVTFSLDAGCDVTLHAAPPYDVVSAEQRERLLVRDPHNVVALELPEGDGDRYENAGALWRSWRREDVLHDDTAEAFYVLEQRFALGGQRVVRRALIAAVDIEPFSAGVILPHERTLPKALTDRLALLRSTAANLSQVFGLYSDPAGVTDDLLDTTRLGPPLLMATDADGVESMVWPIRDEQRRRLLAETLAETRIFIADGHHRYTTALAYRDERRAAESPDGRRPYDSVMMALVNMDDPELVVLPTHRVADAEGPFDESAFLAKLSERFDVADAPVDPAAALRDAAPRAVFVVRTRSGRTVVARLRDDVDLGGAIRVSATDAWKALDVAILQELVLAPLLGIHPDRPETLDRLAFVKDADNALADARRHDATFLLRATRMDQLRAVSLAGELMPQKSTYFYPKLLSGLVMRDISG